MREIAGLVGVSRSSVSAWVRDIVLTPEQHEALRQRNPAYNGQRLGQIARSRIAREQRLRWQEERRQQARLGNAVHAAGCMLFWAEGDKMRTAVRVSNSDPDLLRYFLDFLRRFYLESDAAVRIHCNLFADHVERQHEIERFWLATLRLEPSALGKSIVNVYSKYSQKKRRNTLPYGTCKLVVHSTRVAQCLFGAIQEYGGFSNDWWVDCLPGVIGPSRR